MAKGTPTRRSTPRRNTVNDDNGDDSYDMSPTSNRAIDQAKKRAQALSTQQPQQATQDTDNTTTTNTTPRGPLPYSQETSYHKRLRVILLEHKKCRRDWQELIIRGCVQRTRQVLELISQVE